LFVDISGRVVYLSSQFQGGHVHDKTHFNKEKVVEKLEEMYESVETIVDGKKYRRELGGDKAYSFAAKPKG